MTSTVAIIPARGGSKRLPGKNLRTLHGRPLIAWSIQFALRFSGFDRVLVSTDSVAVRDVAVSFGADVPELRPAELASDTATSIDVLRHEIAGCLARGEVYSHVALLQPTTPWRSEQRWREAENLLDAGAPSVIGVTLLGSELLWSCFQESDGSLTPAFPQYATLRSQDLPRIVTPNGALYWLAADVLARGNTLTPSGTRGVVCTDPRELIDIDTADDLREAENLLSEAGAST